MPEFGGLERIPGKKRVTLFTIKAKDGPRGRSARWPHLWPPTPWKKAPGKRRWMPGPGRTRGALGELFLWLPLVRLGFSWFPLVFGASVYRIHGSQDVGVITPRCILGRNPWPLLLPFRLHCSQTALPAHLQTSAQVNRARHWKLGCLIHHADKNCAMCVQGVLVPASQELEQIRHLWSMEYDVHEGDTCDASSHGRFLAVGYPHTANTKNQKHD